MRRVFQRIFKAAIGCLILFEITHAAPLPQSTLPASTAPGRVIQQFSTEETEVKPQKPRIQPPQEPPTSLGKEAEKVKFKLMKIELSGNHVYSSAELEKIYENKLNTVISVAELATIVQNITNYYRNNGYILTRAILPPQSIKNGTVKVQIYEGYIDQVRILGNPKGARDILYAYGSHIRAQRPITIKVMEHYLYLANSVPGATVRAVLEPSKNRIGASDLNLVVDEQTFNAYVSYDTYGTLYIGPHQVSLGGQANSIFRSGDVTYLNYATASKHKELKYGGITYTTPIYDKGLQGSIGANKSLTQPQFALQSSDIKGNAETYFGELKYPVVRSRLQDLILDGQFNYMDSRVNSFGEPLYTDHIRSVRVGGNYNFSDRFSGGNILGLFVEQGLKILGATSSSTSTETSRFGANGIFTKIDLNVNRLQSLWGRYSLALVAQGQYAFQPLLVEEQFGFGGSQLGRGYDPSEIIGDRGAAGSAELRADVAPGLRLLQSAQLYVFYDAGVIWNLKNVAGVPMKQSATSTGVGSRFNFNKFLSGNVMISQPLTKQIAAYELIGDGRRPRIQFNITAFI